ncbi:hypothetical protein IQ227_10050 [Anabaena aphanizomenioides LEGE 00250]|uniref:Transposase n=1 Tax=Sphaerospermopsis aphanizomenoides LEGE 00250 TaxID=2777972 RepID=A0ABR9VD03_9CYAN|nr:hypothetical protein [Sphaerospermopsis aphanizomenoides LEGE 00250]
MHCKFSQPKIVIAFGMWGAIAVVWDVRGAIAVLGVEVRSLLMRGDRF